MIVANGLHNLWLLYWLSHVSEALQNYLTHITRVIALRQCSCVRLSKGENTNILSREKDAMITSAKLIMDELF